ncbi:MAG: hypothetical protein Q4A16_07985 [Lautropia sp.]|nr:hypothetical protein [Lautropia sp.]
MRIITVRTSFFLLLGLLAGCATSIVDEADPHAPLRENRPAPRDEADAEQDAQPDSRGGKTETIRGSGKPEWAAVFETPPGTRYGDQTVIYVDRNSLTEHKIENLTYYQAITREVRSARSGARIQELAVLCEGSPIAPATSLRGEGTENRDGSYRIKRAPAPLTALSQFSTQRIPIDPKVPSTFVVRAICLLGTDPHR